MSKKQVDSRSAADATAQRIRNPSEYHRTHWPEIRCRNAVGSRQHQAPK